MVSFSCAAAGMEAGQGQAMEGGSLAVVASVAAAAGGRGVAGGGREPEGLPCPRCESVNTKFCYYNNYNLSQPRHYCRACRRYWTRGGALRNVPIGGATRKVTVSTSRRRTVGAQPPAAPASSPAPAAPPLPPMPPVVVPGGVGSYGALLLQYASGLPSFPAQPAMVSPLAAVDPDRRMLDLGGSFTSLIAAVDVGGGGGHFSAGFLVGGLAPGMAHTPAAVAAASLPQPPLPQQQVSHSQALPEGLMWSMGWPDLSI